MIIDHHSIILQKGEPDIKTAAKIILNDFQRGKIPYYVRPPGSDDCVVSVKFLSFCSTAMRASIDSVFLGFVRKLGVVPCCQMDVREWTTPVIYSIIFNLHTNGLVKFSWIQCRGCLFYHHSIRVLR